MKKDFAVAFCENGYNRKLIGFGVEDCIMAKSADWASHGGGGNFDGDDER